MATIELSKDTRGWYAKFIGDKKIVELFGTDTLPTAFTAAAAYDDVERELQRLNPHHTIRRAGVPHYDARLVDLSH